MEEDYVIEFYSRLKNIGIKIWVDGGWGVDALLGKQTRIHKDLDITIQLKDMTAFQDFMNKEKFHPIKPEISRPHNFVLADKNNHEIDVHVIALDEDGNGIYGPAENGETYPAASLTGKGRIGNLEVNCISPEYVLKFHSGYELKEKDYKDVLSVCEKFGLKIPNEYLVWNKF